MAAMPNPNPVISLQMPLDVFNHVQRVLAKRKFSETADIILNFRQQVAEQVEQIRRQQEVERASQLPTRLRAVPEAAIESSEDTA
jgi:ribosomal protein L1